MGYFYQKNLRVRQVLLFNKMNKTEKQEFLQKYGNRARAEFNGTGHTGPSEFCATAFKLFCAARQNAVLRRSPFRPV